MNGCHILRGVVILGLVATGCSSLPGLRVLSGQVTGQDTSAQQTVETSDLVMADKSGMGDPSIMAAADRIEAATNDAADIIEIRRDDVNNAFVVNLVMPLPPDPTDLQASQAYYDTLRRVVETTWQGTLRESEGSGTLQVNVLVSQTVPTLDAGRSEVGFVLFSTSIDRQDAIRYLSQRPHTLNDFGALIADGTMTFDSPQNLYTGQPNHPMFMQNTVASGSQSGQ